MTSVVLFHSVYGLRPAVVAAAEMVRAAGHDVVVPDLYGGRVGRSMAEGFAISAEIGWPVIVGRAREAVRGLADETVLAGLSMGAGVVGELLAERPRTAGLLLLHGVGGEAAAVRAGLPVQVHVGAADEMFPPARVGAWQRAMTAAGARVEVFRYPDVGHFFSDTDVPDHDEAAAGLAWRRSLAFLGALSG